MRCLGKAKKGPGAQERESGRERQVWGLMEPPLEAAGGCACQEGQEEGRGEAWVGGKVLRGMAWKGGVTRKDLWSGHRGPRHG